LNALIYSQSTSKGVPNLKKKKPLEPIYIVRNGNAPRVIELHNMFSSSYSKYFSDLYRGWAIICVWGLNLLDLLADDDGVVARSR